MRSPALQSIQDDDGIVHLRTGFDLARLQVALPMIDESDRARPDCNTADAGITSCRPSGTAMFDIDIHARLQRHTADC